MNSFGWPNQSSSSGNVWISGATNVTAPYWIQTPPVGLPSVTESLDGPLSDREWLDAQIAEVCELATAA